MRQRILGALGANTVAQLVTVLIQLASVPVFLYALGVHGYGEWLLISAIPVYFALADLGVLAVASNEMSMRENGGGEVRSIFSSACLFVMAACVLATSGAILFSVLGRGVLTSTENRIAFVLLVFSAGLSMVAGLGDAVFRATRQYATGTNLVTFARVVEWFGAIAGVLLCRTIFGAALGHCLGRGFASGVIVWQCTIRVRAIPWTLTNASLSQIRTLFGPGLAFLAFPVANAINIQGMTLLVGALYGPAYVVLFNTYRTVTRTVVQAVTIVGRSIWPEMSTRYGTKDYEGLRRIHRNAIVASIAISAAAAGVMWYVGDWFVQAWTDGKVAYLYVPFLLLLAAACLGALSQIVGVVLASTNMHTAFSIYQLAATCVAISAAPALVQIVGFSGLATASVLAEVFILAAAIFAVSRFYRTLDLVGKAKA